MPTIQSDSLSQTPFFVCHKVFAPTSSPQDHFNFTWKPLQSWEYCLRIPIFQTSLWESKTNRQHRATKGWQRWLIIQFNVQWNKGKEKHYHKKMTSMYMEKKWNSSLESRDWVFASAAIWLSFHTEQSMAILNSFMGQSKDKQRDPSTKYGASKENISSSWSIGF